MNSHLQAVLALLISSVIGYTTSTLSWGYSNIYKGQPLASITEFSLNHGRYIYWGFMPLVIIGLWGLAQATKNQKIKAVIAGVISMASAISVIVLLYAITIPMISTTDRLSIQTTEPDDNKAAKAPAIVDGVVIKYYGGSRTILVDFLVEHIRKNTTTYKIPKIITVEYFSSELQDMQLTDAQRATLYLEPAVPSGNRYRWNRIWQYPAFPKTDKEWEGLFQAGRWEYSLSGPWPVPAKPVE